MIYKQVTRGAINVHKRTDDTRKTRSSPKTFLAYYYYYYYYYDYYNYYYNYYYYYYKLNAKEQILYVIC